MTRMTQIKPPHYIEAKPTERLNLCHLRHLRSKSDRYLVTLFLSSWEIPFILNLFLIGIDVLENNVSGSFPFHIHHDLSGGEFEMYILEQDVFSIQYVNVIVLRFYRQLPHRKSGGIIQGTD